MLYAEIIFQQKVGQDEGKETLTYEIPSGLNIETGQLVEVSLRKKTRCGLVWEIHHKRPDFKTLPISSIIHQKPLLNTTQIELIKWMSKHYFCPLHKTLKLFIPKRVFDNKIPRKTAKHDEQINRTSLKHPTSKQQEIIREIKEKTKNKFLIHGVTGSGKTEIYTHLAKEQIQKNLQTLILVPEISLTPQTIDYFESTLGIHAYSIHSQLSDTERYHTWQAIWKNEAKLIIGSRSAIFAPFQKLGLIIIDEEHDSSYKQDQNPRYHAQHVANKYVDLDKQIKLVLGSATPSIESFYTCQNQILHLDCRIGNSKLPTIEIVDLREEFHKKNFSIFSDTLRSEIQNTLAKNEQIILFLNRRGTASSVVCRDCGYTEKCQNCEVPLTYHTQNQQAVLICHHCGRLSKPPSTCANCHGINIRFLGIGTQKIEAEVLKEFPDAKVLRADRDTTGTRDGFKKIYQKFKKHEADILIGTQMIAKGLDLPKVNLVGVVLADIGLNIPDFRSTERNFQLLTQVSGRSGRAGDTGKVIIQTYSPDNLALRYAQQQNYEAFYKYEITQRRLLHNPPFANLVKILVHHRSHNTAQNLSAEIEQLLWKFAREMSLNEDRVEINSYPAYLLRLHNKYRFIILLKDKSGPEMSLLHKLLEKLPKEYIMNPNIKIDIDPLAIT